MVQERVFPALPTTGGRGTIAATFPFEFQGEDGLQLSVMAIVAIDVTVSWRLLHYDGTITVNQQRVSHPGGRALVSWDIPAGVGYVTNALVSANTSAANLGSVYARLMVVRGSGTAAVPIGTLVQGYPCLHHQLFWPGGQSLMPNEGPGYHAVLATAAPGVGAQFAQLVPVDAMWRVRSVSLAFTASAVGGVRRPYLEFGKFGGAYGFRIPATVDCPATGSTVYVWAEGCTQDAAPQFAGPLATLPANFAVFGGWQIRTQVSGMDAGDQWGTGLITYDEWLLPAT